MFDALKWLSLTEPRRHYRPNAAVLISLQYYII